METLTIWLKVAHISTLLIWCAGLFYLPALFAAHPRTADAIEMMRLRAMTRFLYIAVVSPAAVLAVVAGTILIYASDAYGAWLVLKLLAVSVLALFHVACGIILGKLHARPGLMSSAAHLSLMVVPALLIPTILWLVLGKPL